ncbi:MAG: transposase [Archaeoglobaceae archaeon]
MGKQRRRFTREFKISVVNELDSGKSLGQLSREHNLHPTLIVRWRSSWRSPVSRKFHQMWAGKVCPNS